MIENRPFVVAALLVFLPSPAVGQYLAWDQNPHIRTAVQLSIERLKLPACAKMLGPTAVDSLLAANYLVISLGKPTLLPNGKFSLIGAVTIREHNLILLNSEGPFLNPQISAHGVRFNYRLGDNEFRAVLLLHELGHLVGRFKHDAGDANLSRHYSEMVLKKCSF